MTLAICSWCIQCCKQKSLW